MDKSSRNTELKVVPIGNSRGVRLPTLDWVNREHPMRRGA